MRRFGRTLFLFVAPFALLLLPLSALWYCQEVFVDVKAVAKSEEKYVFGLAYSEVGRQFKFLNVSERQRFDVLVLGSSRVMQFRKEMFLKPFYNAGGAVQNVEDYESFLKSLPQEKLPRTIILGLDQWMFNTGYRKDSQAANLVFSWTDVTGVNKNIDKKMRTFLVDAWKGKIRNLFASKAYRSYGVNAVSETNGFRNDGSYFYHGAVQKLIAQDTSYNDFHFKDTMDRINRGCCRFNYGVATDGVAVRQLDSLLAFCKTNQIEVVAFLPPLANAVLQKMRASGKYDYLKMIYPETLPLFEKYGYEFYDFTDIGATSSNMMNEGMIDGFHGGEWVYAKILLQMLATGSKLENCTDAKRLKADADSAENSFIVYRY